MVLNLGTGTIRGPQHTSKGGSRWLKMIEIKMKHILKYYLKISIIIYETAVPKSWKS